MFKERLKKLRLSKGMTQEQLAEKIDVPPSTIRRYESMAKGYPKEERLQVLADFFSCTVDYLLGREMKELTIEEAEREKENRELTDLVNNIEDPIKKEQAISYLRFLANSPTDGAKK